MAVPATLFQYVTVQWAIPTGVTSTLYDTVNIYRSSVESNDYQLLTSLSFLDGSVPRTSYVDTTLTITTKDSWNYMVLFSHSTSGAQSSSFLAFKALTPREQRLVFQLRESLSRFITNRLTDEEIRLYLVQGLGAFNVYSPATEFNLFDLDANMEPLVLLSAQIIGVAHNLLGIGMTDITYNDNGIQVTTNRLDKMTQTFDKVSKAYNELLAVAKLEYATGPVGVGTVQIPIGFAGKIGNVLQALDMFAAAPR